MQDYTSQTITTYNATVKSYTDNVAKLHHNVESQKFISYLGKGKNILDLGCGSGRDALVFTNQGYEYVGVDLSDKMIETAREMCPDADFQRMDIRRLDFPDESFDGIWAVASLLHLPKINVPDCLSEAYRVLKSGGVMYACVKQGKEGNPDEEFKPDNRYGVDAGKFYSYFQPSELELLLERADFTVLETRIHLWNNDYIKHSEIRIFAKKQ